MRFSPGDVRGHIVSQKNDHGASYWRYRVLQRRSGLRISFCEIFSVARFSIFATLSANSRLLRGGTHDDYSITSSAATGRVCVPREAERLRRGRDGVTVVYLLRSAEYQFCNCGVFWMHACRMSTCIEPPWGSRRATWPRKRRRQRRRQPRRKRSNRSTKTLWHPDSVWGPLHLQHGRAAAFAYRLSAQQSGRTVMQMAAA